MSKERLFLYDVGEDDALPVLVAYTAQAAKLELGDVEKFHRGCFVVADCERGDLFLIHGQGIEVWDLYQVQTEDLQDQLVAVECEEVGDWKFNSLTGVTTFKPTLLPGEESFRGDGFQVQPGEWGQLDVMKCDRTPMQLVEDFRYFHIVEEMLGFPRLWDHEPDTAEIAEAYQLCLLAERKFARLEAIQPAVERLLGVLLDNDPGALSTLRHHNERDIRGLAQQVVDELHKALYLLTGSAYTGLLKPTPSEKLQAQPVTHDEGGQ